MNRKREVIQFRCINVATAIVGRDIDQPIVTMWLLSVCVWPSGASERQKLFIPAAECIGQLRAAGEERGGVCICIEKGEENSSSEEEGDPSHTRRFTRTRKEGQA